MNSIHAHGISERERVYAYFGISYENAKSYFKKPEILNDIVTVSNMLHEAFPEISSSKVRYQSFAFQRLMDAAINTIENRLDAITICGIFTIYEPFWNNIKDNLLLPLGAYYISDSYHPHVVWTQIRAFRDCFEDGSAQQYVAVMAAFHRANFAVGFDFQKEILIMSNIFNSLGVKGVDKASQLLIENNNLDSVSIAITKDLDIELATSLIDAE